MIFRLALLILVITSFAHRGWAGSACIDSAGTTLDSLGSLTLVDARESYDQLLCSTPANLDLACLHYYYGSRLFREGLINEAYTYFSAGADILGKSHLMDSLLLHKLRYNSGIAALRMLEYSTAVDWFKSARAAAEDPVDMEKCHIKIAKCYRESGDLFLANYYLQIAARKLEGKPEGLKWLIETYGTLGINNNESGNAEQAIHFLQLQRQLIQANDPAKHRSASITNYLEIGNAYETLGNFAEAVDFYERSLKEAVQEGDLVNQYRNYNNLGFAYNQDGQYLKAIVHLRKSRQLAADVLRDSIRLSFVESTIGDTYFKSGVYDKAVDQYYRALSLITPGFVPGDHRHMPKMAQLKDLDYLHEVFGHCKDLSKGLSALALETGDSSLIRSALNYIELADSILFSINRNSIDDRSKFFWRGEAREIYTLAIDLEAARNNMDGVFYFLERNKYFVLRSMMADNMQLSHAESSLRDSISDLREAIAVAQIKLQQDPQNINAIEQLVELKETLHRSMASVTAINGAPGSALVTASLDNFRQREITNDSTLYLSYHIAGNALYRLAIHRDSAWLDVVEFGNVDNLTLRAFLDRVSRPFHTQSERDDYFQKASYLFRKILPDGIDRFHSLIVNPDGLLHYLPFDALCSDRLNEQLLIDEYTVRYILTPFLSSQPSDGERKGKTLIVAPATFGDQGLAALPYTEQEAKRIRQITDGKLLAGTSAGKTNVLHALADFQNIHLATHAQSGIGDHGLPWLALRDEKIYLPEIYNLDLHGKFIVLSACETFKGEQLEGEGILNLVWALQYSGANHIVATLWNAYDQAQDELMAAYYTVLLEGKNHETALRQAKLLYRENIRRDPCYWASPVYIGESTTFHCEPTSKKGFAGVLIAMLLALLYMASRMRRIAD